MVIYVRKNIKKYIFICAYAQSRSKYFAERFIQEGNLALFCGHQREADIILSQIHLDWSDVIVVLDKDIIYEPKPFDMLAEEQRKGKPVINFWIDDTPSTFEEKYQELLSQTIILPNKSEINR